MSQFFASSGQSIGISPEVKYEDKVTCQSYLKKKKTWNLHFIKISLFHHLPIHPRWLE